MGGEEVVKNIKICVTSFMDHPEIKELLTKCSKQLKMEKDDTNLEETVSRNLLGMSRWFRLTLNRHSEPNVDLRPIFLRAQSLMRRHFYFDAYTTINYTVH